MFCEEIKEGRVFFNSTGDVVYMPDKYPVSYGHILVIPVRHVESIKELSERETHNLFKTVKRLLVLLENELGTESFQIILNQKLWKIERGGHVKHLHVHLIPRYGKEVVPVPKKPEKLFDKDVKKLKTILKKLGNV